MRMIATATIGTTISATEPHSSGPSFDDARAKTPGALFAQITYVLPDMYRAGFPQSLATTYAIAQMMMESDWFTSKVAHVDNNYSGITWINKPYQHATRGMARPGKEGGYYAHFATFADWAKDFLRILSLNTGKKGRPIDAATANEFGDRLRANHYATDPNYAAKFNAALRKVNEALQFGISQNKNFQQAYNNGQTTFTADQNTGVTPGKTFDKQALEATFNGYRASFMALPAWERWAFGLIAIIAATRLIKR